MMWNEMNLKLKPRKPKGLWGKVNQDEISGFVSSFWLGNLPWQIDKWHGHGVVAKNLWCQQGGHPGGRPPLSSAHVGWAFVYLHLLSTYFEVVISCVCVCVWPNSVMGTTCGPKPYLLLHCYNLTKTTRTFTNNNNNDKKKKPFELQIVMLQKWNI